MQLIGLTIIAQQSKKIREIISELDSKYDLKGKEPSIGFEKRNKSWYITTLKLENNLAVTDKKYLFYNSDSAKFFPLPFPENQTIVNPDPSAYISKLYEHRYDLHNFYGYNGWYRDVIKSLEGNPSLTDTELYSLAEAYSAYADGLIFRQADFGIDTENFKTGLCMNCLSENQIIFYDSIEKKAIEYYYEVAERNPAFETLVGPVARKWANEVMNYFHQFTIVADNYSQIIKLPEYLYGSEDSVYAVTMLNACPKNAILLTFGDNDFYPILYFQYAKNIRRDVYLISYNYFNVDNYVFRTTFPMFNSQKIILSLDSSEYSDPYNLYLQVVDSLPTINFSSIIDIMKTKRNDKTKVINSKTFVFNLKNLSNSKPKTVTFNGDVLARYQWIILDIINNLKGRKFCFTDKFTDELTGLNDLMINKNGILIFDN